MISRSHRIAQLQIRRQTYSRRIPQHRHLSTNDVTVNTPKRLVVSRRAWMDLQKELPSKGPKTKPPPVEEKPWPQSVQIAGYVGGALLFPYFAIWTITSNPTLREYLGPYLPMDSFRSHFGQMEWDVQSYVDEMQLPYDKDEAPPEEVVFVKREVPNVQFYQFPDEPGFQDRQQQKRIEELDQSNIQVKIHVYENSNGVSQSQQEFVKTIPGTTLATVQNMMGLVQGAVQNAKGMTVAVDFEDDDDNSNTNPSDETSVIIMGDEQVPESTQATNPAEALLKKTQIFSSWFYVSSAQPQEEQKTSDTQMTISRLEYTIEELQRNLKDPTCTRDMDEMADELKKAKRELSGLKWKRRLGWK